ncbi:MAG: hypothetical protein ACM3KR_10535 [Deltaproteobacteria bacterium]
MNLKTKLPIFFGSIFIGVGTGALSFFITKIFSSTASAIATTVFVTFVCYLIWTYEEPK